MQISTTVTLLAPFFSVPALYPASLSFQSFAISVMPFQRGTKQSMVASMS